MTGIGFNPYAAGHKVYNGGSSAAHSGMKLDPIGYIERSLRLSAAQNAMGQGGFDIRKYNPFYQPPKKKSGGNKNKKKGRHSSPGVVTGNDNAGPDEIANDNLSAVQTPIISSPTGQLSLDFNLAQDKADAENIFNQNNINFDAQQADLTSQYGVGRRDLGIQQRDDQRGDLNRFAGRGMAYSSGYGQEVSDSARMFTNAFGDLDTQYGNGLNALAAARLNNQNYYNSTLSNIAQRQAAFNAENAGTLGLDPNFSPPVGAPMPRPSNLMTYRVAPSVKAKAAAANAGSKKKKHYKGKRPGPG